MLEGVLKSLKSELAKNIELVEDGAPCSKTWLPPHVNVWIPACKEMLVIFNHLNQDLGKKMLKERRRVRCSKHSCRKKRQSILRTGDDKHNCGCNMVLF